MSRTLAALKALEARHATESPDWVEPSIVAPRSDARPAAAAPASPPMPSTPAEVVPVLAQPLQAIPVAVPLPVALQPVQAVAVAAPTAIPMEARPAEAAPAAIRRPRAAAELCRLPSTPKVGEHYLEMAEAISEQGAANYCNVLLLVTPDHAAHAHFSMTHLAQAMALQSAGDILLVDGDLRNGRLSRAVCPPAPGMVEAMHGSMQWLDLVHPTNVAGVHFVPRGLGHVPMLERSQFGWGTLRPKYRAVLIGLSDTNEPETTWLAARCDGVYLVLSLPRTPRRMARKAAETLETAGANLLGCIATGD